MTERLLKQLETATGTEALGKKAYLDIWRALRDLHHDTKFIRSGEFPRASKKRGQAYIPQETLNVVFTNESDLLKQSFDSRRNSKKSNEVFGGLSNDELLFVIELQVPRKLQTSNRLRKDTSRFFSNLRFAIPLALISQILDINDSTPDVLRGHIKDTMAVPVMISLLPRQFKDERANAALLTSLLFAWEFSQQFVLSSRVTYDPLDLAAYSIGAIGYLTFDELRKKIRPQSSKENK